MAKYKLIDVSMWMDSFTFPENPKCEPKGPFNRVSGNKREYVYDFELCTQSGTHIQGSHYFLEDGKRIDEFPLSSFEGDAVIVDIKRRGVDTTKEELREELGDTDLDGKILILRSGHMDELVKDGKLDSSKRPGLSLEAAKYLAETKKVKMIAIDSIGVESRETKNYEVNKYLCEKGVLILEGLVNLDKISKGEVFLDAFPLKIKGVEGTPCRTIVKE